MKASELMVGDWVNLSKGNFSENRQVGLVDIEMIAESVYLAEPIPLTPEILEKNGFTRPNVRVQYFAESTDYYDVDIHEITDSIWCFEYQNCEAHFPPCLILIAHVHEFQHALRLCGIEKEITI